MTYVLRTALSEDAPAMTHLRAQLFQDLAAGGSASRPEDAGEDGWGQACTQAITEQLSDPDHHYAVAVTAAGEVVAWGHAIVIHQLPGPGFPTGLMGQISSVVADPNHRGRGLGSSVSAALVAWLCEQGAEVIDLLASHDSAGMYRRLGFTEPRSTALRYLRP